jgi:hypothetical protein
VAEAEWADPVELARPAAGEQAPGMTASGVAYSNTKLAILYYAHELQRHAGTAINVSVFEPGWMPGTALGRGAPAAFQAMGRALGRLPGVSTPQRSGRCSPQWPRRQVGTLARRRVRGQDQADRGAADRPRPRPGAAPCRRRPRSCWNAQVRRVST